MALRDSFQVFPVLIPKDSEQTVGQARNPSQCRRWSKAEPFRTRVTHLIVDFLVLIVTKYFANLIP